MTEQHTTTLTARKFFTQPHPLPLAIATMERAVNHEPLDFATRMACADAYEEEGWLELAAIHRARASALKGRFTYWNVIFGGGLPDLYMVVPHGLNKRCAAKIGRNSTINGERVQFCMSLPYFAVCVAFRDGVRDGDRFLRHPDRKQEEVGRMPSRQRLIEAALETLYLVERLESDAPGQPEPVRFPSQIHMIGTMP